MEVGRRDSRFTAPLGARLVCPPGHPLPRDPGILAPSPLRPPAGPRAWVVSPQDKLCGAFWRLVLAQRWMGRLKTVAGSEMEKLLEDVNTEIHFVTSCAFQVSPELGDKCREPDAFLGIGSKGLLGLTGGFPLTGSILREVELEPQTCWGPVWEVTLL